MGASGQTAGAVQVLLFHNWQFKVMHRKDVESQVAAARRGQQVPLMHVPMLCGFVCLLSVQNVMQRAAPQGCGEPGAAARHGQLVLLEPCDRRKLLCLLALCADLYLR